jgi:hypothetical protein
MLNNLRIGSLRYVTPVLKLDLPHLVFSALSLYTNHAVLVVLLVPVM